MRTTDFLVEPYASAPDAIVRPLLLLFDLVSEVVFGFSDTCNDTGYVG
jgi:hypothetical protein